MFLNKIRNIFCVPDTNFVSETNVARVGKRENNVSATMCPRLPGPSHTLRVCEARALHTRGSRLRRFPPSENDCFAV